jgi:hypothetical protein
MVNIITTDLYADMLFTSNAQCYHSKQIVSPGPIELSLYRVKSVVHHTEYVCFVGLTKLAKQFVITLAREYKPVKDNVLHGS